MRRFLFVLLMLVVGDPAAAQLTPISTGSPAPGMALPDTVYVVVGRELNIYDNQLSTVPYPNAPWFFDYECSVGKVMDDRFRWRCAAADTQTLTITAYDWMGRMIEQDSTVLCGIAATTGAGTKKALFVGDSIIDGGIIVAEADSLFSTGGGANIVPVGTQTDNVGGLPYYHEGRGGWTWERFASRYTTGTTDNPFWKFDGDYMDFEAYMDTAGISGNIDLCVVHLGGNEAYAAANSDRVMSAAEIDTVITEYAKVFVDSLLADYPDSRILITLMPISSGLRSSFGDDYNAQGWGAEYFRNVRAIERTLTEAFDAGAYHAQVDVCNAGLSVDNEHGYPTATEDSVAFRILDDVTVGTNFLHPDTDGRYQMADAIYSHLLHMIGDIPTSCSNLLVNSDGWATATNWTDISATQTMTAGQADPFGGTDATLFTAAATDAYINSLSDAITISSTTAVVSAFVKNSTRSSGEKTSVRINDMTDNAYASVTISWVLNTVASTGTLATAVGIEDLGGGWYQIWAAVDVTGRTANSWKVMYYPNYEGVEIGDAVFCAGVQVEAGVTTPDAGCYISTP